MIRIEALNQAALLAFVASADYVRLPVVPITPLRARSQAHNPRLHADDVLLLLAYGGESQLVGYLGIMPDTVYLTTGEARHCGWVSGLWVSPECRGQGIAQQLFARMLDAWQGQLFITEYVPATEQLCRKSGRFRDLCTSAGLRLYLRADLATLLPPKSPALARARPLLRLLDRAANAALSLRQALQKQPPALQVEYVSEVDAEAAHFIRQHQGRQLTRQGAAELNWLLHCPWLREAPQPDADGRRYYFSSTAAAFGTYALKVRDAQGQLSAFLILARRNNALKIPCCYHCGNVGQVAEVIFQHLRRWRIATFTTFQPDLVQYLRTHPTPALLQRPMHRGYMVSTDVERLPETFDLQDGEADARFT